MSKEKTTQEIKKLLNIAGVGNLIPERLVAATIEKLEQLQAENDKLKEFARSVIQIECWGSYEPDGLGTQDLAEKLGLVKSSIATEEDINDESDFEAGDRIYKFADILKVK